MSGQAESRSQPPSLTDLPDDELLAYGRDLGLDLDVHAGRGELLRLIRQRQELLLELDRAAMLDVVVWARCPVRRTAGKDVLARQIAKVHRAQFDGLSDRGLGVLARLRGLDMCTGEPRAELERRLKKVEGFRAKLRRARRGIAAAVISRVIARESSQEYRFLPEDESHSLREEIKDEGVVGGIARKIRGAADDYVREKMDEIETRIDRKLDEIDHRLGEWRDREVANRLKILKITLLVTILVALVSLGYDVVQDRLGEQAQAPSPGRAAEVSAMPRESQPSLLEGEEPGGGASSDVREAEPTR
ncbi:MAG TPA: hypothetical protein VM243_00195 [Phycisphaerae bacterium]|nr:hypothetical protein [Phycisphaerae bacterium]